MSNRYVLTGGPGAGKTTILNALEEHGYRFASESARRIIKERLRQGLPPRPEPHIFAEEILRSDIDQYREIDVAEEPVFYDRGVLDALYMLDASGALSREMAASYVKDFPYNKIVFVLPPWEAIYSADSERDQTFQEALEVFEGMKHWYSSWQYETVEVPRIDVKGRVEFILQAVGEPLTRRCS